MGTSAAPHIPQKRDASGFSVPQAGQVCMRHTVRQRQPRGQPDAGTYAQAIGGLTDAAGPSRSDAEPMRSPFRSEHAAFHFLLLTVAAFAIVIAASLGGTVAAIVAWAVVSAFAVAVYAHGQERSEPEVVPHVGRPDERRIVVVAPLRASPLHRLANDVDAEQEDARIQAAAVVGWLGAPHVRVTTAVGEDPVAAVDDALHTFGGDEILVLPGDDSLVERLRERYALPVTQMDSTC